MEFPDDSETFYLRLGLEPTCLGLQPKPSFKLEPTCLELEPGQNPWYLISGPNKAQVLDVSLQKEFSERQSDR